MYAPSFQYFQFRIACRVNTLIAVATNVSGFVIALLHLVGFLCLDQCQSWIVFVCANHTIGCRLFFGLAAAMIVTTRMVRAAIIAGSRLTSQNGCQQADLDGAIFAEIHIPNPSLDGALLGNLLKVSNGLERGQSRRPSLVRQVQRNLLAVIDALVVGFETFRHERMKGPPEFLVVFRVQKEVRKFRQVSYRLERGGNFRWRWFTVCAMLLS